MYERRRVKSRSRKPDRKPEPPGYEFDAATISFLDSITQLDDNRASFSLDFYKSEALKLFVEGMVPMVDYYTKADMGAAGQKQHIKKPKPWSALDIAEIFHLHEDSFKNGGVRSPIKDFGKLFGELLRDVNYKVGVEELIASFKIVKMCLDGMKIFPKERPKSTPYIPIVDFDEVVLQLSLKRKEMKKVWKQCCGFVEMYTDKPEGLMLGWGQYEPVLRSRYNPMSEPIAPVRPMPKTPPGIPLSTSSQGFFLGVRDAGQAGVSKEVARVTEKYEVSTKEEFEEDFQRLKGRDEAEWGLGGNFTFPKPPPRRPFPQDSFPGASKWFD